MRPKATATRRLWAVAAWAVAGSWAAAGDAVWNRTAAGSYDWNAPANWLPDTEFPNGAGEAAFVTNDLAGAQTLRLRQDVTLGLLATGDGAAVGNNYSLTYANASGEAFALTLDSGAPGVPARIVLGFTGTATSYLNVPTALASDLLVELNGTDASNRQQLTLNGIMALNGRTLSYTNGVYGQQHATFGSGSEFVGEGRIVNNSRSCVNVDGKKAFAGTLVANGKATSSNQSTFTFTSGGFTNASEIVVNGVVTNSNVREGGGLHAGSGSLYDANPGQRLTRRRITLNAGYLVANGQAAKVGTANDWQMGLEWVRDEVATLDFSSGYCYLAVAKGGNTQGTELSVGEVRRARGASVYLFGPNGADKRLVAANGASLLRGAGGPAGGSTLSVVPWIGVYASGGFVNPAGFGTYEAGTGFRALDLATEYAAAVTAGADHNVSANSVALAADAEVNALRFTGGSSNIGAGRTLTLRSGGLFFANNGAALGASGHEAAGTLDFGGAEGVVSVHALNTATIGAVIAGTNGLSKIQSGTLVLTGANTYDGPTHVGGGTLRVGDGTVAGRLGDGAVTVHAGAVLRLSCASAIPGGAELRLGNTGPDCYFGRVEVDADVNATVRFLYLGGAGMPAGTYGGSASAAAVKDDRYFAGTGVLTVTGSADAIGRGTVISVL